MKLVAAPDNTVDRYDRALWLTPVFDIAFGAATTRGIAGEGWTHPGGNEGWKYPEPILGWTHPGGNEGWTYPEEE